MKIKDTKSLCPECGRPLDAEVYDEDGKVYIKKTCKDHGEFRTGSAGRRGCDQSDSC